MRRRAFATVFFSAWFAVLAGAFLYLYVAPRIIAKLIVAILFLG